MKEFITEVVETVIDGETTEERTYPFKIDGRECAAYKPKDGQFALLVAMIGDNSGWRTQAEGIINFFLNIVTPLDRVYFANRLLDRKDTFDVENVADILMYLIEEWSGNPTQESSDSTPSQPDGGLNSA